MELGWTVIYCSWNIYWCTVFQGWGLALGLLLRLWSLLPSLFKRGGQEGVLEGPSPGLTIRDMQRKIPAHRDAEEFQRVSDENDARVKLYWEVVGDKGFIHAAPVDHALLEQEGYTFESNFIHIFSPETQDGPRLHYVDTKRGSQTILCVHGEPTWSFLYRKMIHSLAAENYRVVAPDFIGFGLSDKFTESDSYSQKLHMATLKRLILELDLRNIVLVCQDWGGLISLPVVKDMPSRFARAVIMNTGLPPLPLDPFLRTPLRVCRSAVNFFLWRSVVFLLGRWLPVGQILRFSCTGISPGAVACYGGPFPSAKYKAGPSKWPLMVPIHPWDNPEVGRECRAAAAFLASEEWAGKATLLMFR